MFAPTTLFWELPTDLGDQDYSRCGWSYEQWVNFIMEVTLPDTQRLWQWANSDKVQTQFGDDTTNDKIFRFATMSQEFCIKIRSFALSKGITFSLSGFELWESLALARTAVKECRLWKSGTKDKVLARVCYIVGKWNRVCVNKTVNDYINKYLAKYKTDECKQQMVIYSSDIPTTQSIFKTDCKSAQTDILTIDEWNNISWTPQKGDKLILSDAALYVSLHLKLGVVRRCPLISGDNDTLKDASFELCDCKEMDTLFSEAEFNEIFKHNKDNNMINKSIEELFDKTKQYVCTFVTVLFFLFCFVF